MAKQNQDELVFEGSSDFDERDSIQLIILLFSTVKYRKHVLTGRGRVHI